MAKCEFCGTEHADLHLHVAKEHSLWPLGTSDGKMYYAEIKTLEQLKEGTSEPETARAEEGPTKKVRSRVVHSSKT